MIFQKGFFKSIFDSLPEDQLVQHRPFHLFRPVFRFQIKKQLDSRTL